MREKREVKLAKIFFIFFVLVSFANAGLLDLIKDIFSSSENKKVEKKREIVIPPPKEEVIIEEVPEESVIYEEYIPKVSIEKYPFIYKIAFLLPKKIGKYRETTVNSVISYLIRRERNFDIKTYDIYGNDFSYLSSLLARLENSDTHLIVAPVTKSVAETLCSLYARKIIYIPTISKNSVECSNPNVYFGGMDYLKQFEKLSKIISYNRGSVTVRDVSPLAKELNYYSSFYFSHKLNIIIKSNKDIKRAVLGNKKYLKNSNIILNTPIVKSSLFLSTLYFYSIKPRAVFSTQINFNPKIFTLTQYKMRKNFYIANSIGRTYVKYYDTAKLLDAGIRFDRVNYATVNGVDYFFVKSYTDRGRIFREEMIDNSLVYQIKIVVPKAGRFVTILK